MSRWSVEPNFVVRHVVSTDFASGTYAEVYASTISNNALLRLRDDLEAEHGGRASVHTGFGPRDAEGRRMAFRWAWDRKLPNGTRQSEALFVKVLSWP